MRSCSTVRWFAPAMVSHTGTLRLPKGAHHLHLEQAGYQAFDQDVSLDGTKPLLLTPSKSTAGIVTA